MSHSIRSLALVACAAAALFTQPAAAQSTADDDRPSVLELSTAENYVKQFEFEADRAEGKPFDSARFGGTAMEQVRSLKKRYPTDPDVDELFERVRVCVKRARGGYFEITAEMTRYKEIERIVAARLAELALEFVRTARAELEPSGRLLANPFPAPDPTLADDDLDMFYRKVVLEDFQYPACEFTNSGRQYVRVGNPATGFYFVELSNRRWIGAYEAIRRYRRQAAGGLPESWTLIGTVVGSEMLVPRTGEAGAADVAYFGWLVRPDVIVVPGRTCAVPDASHPHGGRFIGEDELPAIKAPLLSHTEVPNGATASELVEVFCAALKEKNYGLFSACIDPELRSTPLALERLERLWDVNQEGFERQYVHVAVVSEGDVRVLAGERLDDEDLDAFFLDDEDKAQILERADVLVEEVHVTVRRYGAKGKQIGTPRDVVLRRREGGRWYVRQGLVL